MACDLMADEGSLRIDVWADLNPEVLTIIAKKLGDIANFVRFRAVCKPWRSATNPSDAPPQFPWLMLLKIGDTPKLSLYSLPSCKIFSVPLFGARSMNYTRSSTNEFLLEEKDNKDYFQKRDRIFRIKLNHHGRDVSGSQVVPLPPVGILPKFFLNLQLSDESKCPTIVMPSTNFVAHHERRIFLHETGYPNRADRIIVIDDATGEFVSTVACPKVRMNRGCLISTRDGVLLVDKKYAPPRDDVPYEDHKFTVYRLENYNTEPRWNKLSGIGDMMLFLDDRNSFSLMAGDYDGFRGNCVYFITNLKGIPTAPLIKELYKNPSLFPSENKGGP